MGETFSQQEATTLFFGATKLFQHKDPALRQMVYLAIKELSKLAQDVIMVTASIMKDMQPNVEVIYRPNAIRALCRVVDPSMAQGIERYFKSAIVDRNSSISSAAIVSAYQLQVAAKEVVRRWGNEAQEAINPKLAGSSSQYSSGGRGGGGFGSYLGFAASAAGYGGGGMSDGAPNGGGSQIVASSSFITQYHALGLLYLIRQGDRMAVTKMVQQYGGGGSASTVIRNPFAICMLVRFAARIAEEDPNLRVMMMDMLENWLRHKSDMVNLEAAKAISEIRGVTAQELAKPVAVLQLFLSSPRSPLKFAAIRTLSKLAQTHPASVQACNVDMENLITDNNRSVATFAITTLLKTGNEASVDRLMKQISSFMSEISDEFKVIVVDAIRSLCLKFPTKQTVMLSFLAGVLRDEGGYDFKRAVVEAIFDMVNFIGDCKETALAHLCEFIEDCEFTKLSVRILHLLGAEGPKMPEPHKYIRYIYNRVILENAIVRAAAVSALAKFGLQDKSLAGRIKTLLERCLNDVDDEVRDRAVMHLRVLKESRLAERLVSDESSYKLSSLEAQLQAYVSDPSAAKKVFDTSAVPKVSKEEAKQEALRARNEAVSKVAMAAEPTKAGIRAGEPSTSAAGAAAMATSSSDPSRYAKELEDIPEFKSFGPVLKSSNKPTELTERETEYVATAVKHIFAEHIVLQYNITNTLPDTVLENVRVVVGGAAEGGLREDFILPSPNLSASSPSGTVYVSFTRQSGPTDFPQARLSNTLKFTSKEVDPSSGEPEEEGYDDEYQTEEMELGVADYMTEAYADWNKEWAAFESSGAPSATETFALTALDSLKSECRAFDHLDEQFLMLMLSVAACDTLVELFGMQPLGGSEMPTSSSVHTLTLSGLVALPKKPAKVLARCRMTFEQGQGVTMELSIKGEQQTAVDLVLSAIA